MTSPGIACLTGLHVHVDVLDEAGLCAGGWCLWCGGGTYDAERIHDDGEAIGFTPTFTVRLEDGFHRLPEDAA